jgi:tetratricopeptide (TPR) repeat protein
VTRGVPLSAYFLDPNTTTTRPDYNHEIYRPLRNLTYRAIAAVFGVRPAAYEAVSLFLYLVLTALTFLVIASLTRERTVAFVATALWVLLPVHVQAVAYPSALGDLLSAVLEISALLAAVSGGLGWAIASILLAAAAMFAKEMAVTEPLLLLLAMWWTGRRRWWLLGAHLAVSGLYVVTRSWVLGRVAQLPLTPAIVLQGFAKAPVLLVEYARLSLMPLGHRAFYSVEVTWASVAVALTVIAVVAAAAWRLRSRLFTLGLVGFVLALLPVLNLLPIRTDLADRFALLPSIGLALAIAAILPRRAAGYLIAGFAGLILFAGTLVEERMYYSDGALWRYTVDRDPGVGVSHANLANVLIKEGRPGEALVELDRARALGFDFPFIEIRRARALDEIGRTSEAIRVLEGVLKETPSQGQLHAILGELYLRTHQLELARLELEQAEKLAPDAPVTRKLQRSLR